MDYEAVWKVLSDLSVELQRSGEEIPTEVIRNLNLAKTLVGILEVDPDNIDGLRMIEEHLSNAESYLITVAQRRIGSKRVKEWERRIAEARRKPPRVSYKPVRRFIPGIPRDRSWIRIKPPDEVPMDRVKTLAGEEGLEVSVQEDGYLLICGDKKRIRSLLNRIAQQFRKR